MLKKNPLAKFVERSRVRHNKPKDSRWKIQNNGLHELELQISHSFRAEIQAEGVFGEKCVEIGKIIRSLCEWKNVVKIANCIRHQLDEDKFGEQLTMLGKM